MASAVLYEPGTNRPYLPLPNGGRSYLSPAAMGETTNRAPNGSFFKNRGTWNTQTGQWDTGVNWGNVLALGIGGALAAPAVAGAFGAGAGGGLSAAGMPALSAPAAVLPAGGAGLIGAGGAGMSTFGTIGHILGSNAGLNAVNQGVGALSGYFANRSQTHASDRAAELESQAAAASLEFLKQQEAQRMKEWQATQDKNYQLYQEQQARLAPYRQMGQASLGQLGQPIPRGSGSTLADLLR